MTEAELGQGGYWGQRERENESHRGSERETEGVGVTGGVVRQETTVLAEHIAPAAGEFSIL